VPSVSANQFFNESQFESYRHLGSFIVDSIVKDASDGSETMEIENFNFALAASRFWSSKVEGPATPQSPSQVSPKLG